jgi:Fic family protein
MAGKKLNITEDALRAEMASYLGKLDPIIPPGRGMTMPEMYNKFHLSRDTVRTQVSKQLQSGKLRPIGKRNRAIVYEAV